MILVFVLGDDDGDDIIMDNDNMDEVYDALHSITDRMTEFINSLGVVVQPPPEVLTLLNCVTILLDQAIQYLN